MRKAEFLPAVLFGLLVGWIGRSIWNGENLPLGDLLTAAVTLLVGWLISEVVRRRGELDKVPLGRIEKAFGHVEDLVWEALERRWATPRTGNADERLVTILRMLSNELNFVKQYARAVALPTAEFEALWDEYIAFKEALTGGPHIRAQRAAVSGQNLRFVALRVQWQICRKMLTETIDFGSDL